LNPNIQENNNANNLQNVGNNNQNANQNNRQNRQENEGFGLAAAFLDGAPEDVSFEELIGLKGPIMNLFENIFWVLLFNAVFLGCFAFLPFITGDLATKVFFFFFIYLFFYSFPNLQSLLALCS